MAAPKLTTEQRRLIANSGENPATLATRFGVTEAYVVQLKRNHLLIGSARQPVSFHDKLRAVQSGKSPKVLAEEYNVNISSVYHWIKMFEDPERSATFRAEYVHNAHYRHFKTIAVADWVKKTS